jgi:PAS domain S-box-containing protein
MSAKDSFPESGTPSALPGISRESLFQTFVESIGDYAIFLLDPNGMVMSWNKGAERIKRYKANEIIGKHFSTFYTQESRDRDWPATELKEATRVGRFEDEGWRVRADGTRFWANVVIHRAARQDGVLRGFSKITRDLTERREQEERLRRSEERFRLLVDGVQDYAIYMLDPDGKITSWNSGAQRITGYNADQVIGRSTEMFHRPKTCARTRRAKRCASRSCTAGRTRARGACARTVRPSGPTWSPRRCATRRGSCAVTRR